MQVIEYRILPAISALLAVAGIVLIRAGGESETKGIRVTVFAFGLLAYSYFELALYRMTGDILAGAVAHEVAEFWFLIVLAEFLKESFARERSPEGAPGTSSPLPAST